LLEKPGCFQDDCAVLDTEGDSIGFSDNGHLCHILSTVKIEDSNFDDGMDNILMLNESDIHTWRMASCLFQKYPQPG